MHCVTPRGPCVRQVFRAIKCFVGKLEKVSENGELLAEMGEYSRLFHIPCAVNGVAFTDVR